MICYLTGVEITSNNRSEEHIIPNALGGHLKSKDVLCSQANLELSTIIDVPFNKQFEGTYRRLPLKKDRETDTGYTATHLFYNERVIYKDNKCFPWKPFYDEVENIVYAQTTKKGNDWLKHLKAKGKIPKDKAAKIRTDLGGAAEISFNLNNQIFAKGLAKIGAGYATLNGIARNNLKGILDLSLNKFKDDISIIPFLPLTPFDHIFELHNDKSTHYPVHALSLKGIKEDNLLYCYVELFSTFQYVVILDDAYEGDDINRTYIYDLLGGDEINFGQYLGSVQESLIFTDALKSFRDFDRGKINQLLFETSQDPHKTTVLKKYTHYKFYCLEIFVACVSMKIKMDILEREIDD